MRTIVRSGSTILALIFLSAPITVCAQDIDRPIGKAVPVAVSALVAANVADLVTTHQALAAGAVENVPWMRGSSLKRSIIVGAEMAGYVWLARKVAPRHPKLVVGVTYVLTAVTTGISIRNYHVKQQQLTGMYHAGVMTQ